MKSTRKVCFETYVLDFLGAVIGKIFLLYWVINVILNTSGV